jgi:hypothetical protein
MGARRFDPSTTRFIQRDSFADAQTDVSLALDEISANRYALASGKPTGFIELDGHLTVRQRYIRGIRLNPTQREQIFNGFFNVYTGTQAHYKRYLGYGRGLDQFLEWEIFSRRIVDGDLGSDWWEGVNGWMAQDMRDAQRLLKRGKRASANRPINYWMKYGIESRRKSSRDRQQRALWRAHQYSLHCGIALAAGDWISEPVREQKFIEQAIHGVDLAVIGNQETDGDKAYTGLVIYYPRQYPATGDDAQRVRSAIVLAIALGQLPNEKNAGFYSTRWSPSC